MDMTIGRIVPAATATANQSQRGKDGSFASFFNRVVTSLSESQPEVAEERPVMHFGEVGLRDVMAAVDQETETILKESQQVRKQAINAYGAILGM
ncbi:MAG: flagellar hook-basal body complex protein FliE [Candidatus Sericytochromatia bacterium]|nr:flagellar hook-basal body complex protein FliE [Candidatus Sericytochromatia bacterium]